MGACDVPKEFMFDLKEIMEISWGIVTLSYINEKDLLNSYMETFRNGYMYGYLKNTSMATDRVFGTIMPKYRNKPPLKYHLNDTQVVLAYCFKSNGINRFPAERNYSPTSVSVYDAGYHGLGYMTLKLLPLSMTQVQANSTYPLNRVIFGGDAYYHPNQYVVVPQSMLSVCSFFESIRQPRIRHSLNNEIRLQLVNNRYIDSFFESQKI